MFITKFRSGAGSRNKRDQTMEAAASRMEGHGSPRPFAECGQSLREVAQAESNRGFRANELTLQGLIEASVQGVLIVTKEHELLLANQSCARIFDFESPAEIMALDSIADLIAVPALARLDAFETQILNGSKTTKTHELEGIRKDGSIVRLISMVKEIDWRGRRAIVLTLFENFSNGKAEAALSEREAQLGAIMDNAPAEIYLKDRDGRYLRINRRYEDLWDVKDEDVRGKLPGDIHSPKTFAEESRAHDLAVLQSERAIEHEQVVFLEGSAHTLHMIKFPIRDADGNISGLGAIATDITERKRAEAALQKARDELEVRVEERTAELRTTNQTLRNEIAERKRVEEALRDGERRLQEAERIANLGYWLWDEVEDKMIDCSEEYARIHGVSRKEYLSGSTTAWEDELKWIHPEDREHYNEIVNQAYRQGKPCEIEYRIARPNGEIRHILERSEPISYQDGVVTRTLGTIQDVTEQRRAEETLRTREAWLSAILDNSPVEIVLKDTDGRIIAISRNVADILGLEVNDLIGGTTANFLSDHVAAEYMAGDRKVLETGRPLQREIVEEMEGSTRHYLNEKFPLKDGVGEITGICSISSDITELKQAEVRLRDAIESIPGGFILYDADERFVLCNQKYRDFYPEIDPMFVPSAKREDLARAVFASCAVIDAIDNVEDRTRDWKRQPRGAQATHEQHLSDGRWLLCSERGTMDGGIVGIHTDITALREAQDAARNSEVHLHAIVDNIADGIITIDTGGIMESASVSAERMFGYEADELIGRNVSVLMPEPDRSGHDSYIQCYIETGRSSILNVGPREVTARRKDGSTFPMELTIGEMRVDGKPLFVGAVRDISKRREAESALHRLSARLISAQEDERSRIARELHDDFNQRLALLAVDLERCHDGLPGLQENLIEGLASLLRRTKELSSDVHRLSHQLHPSILQHLGLVAAARSFCKEISAPHDIQIELVHHDIPRSLPRDVALCLYRIIQEALRNVIKHSGAESARVEITRTASELILQISDNGIGFDSKSDQSRRGLGLLSMSERLRQVDGTISVMQNEPTGTRIDVRLPFSDSSQEN